MSFSAGDRFTVKGQLADRPVTVTYDQGRLDGDDEAVSRITEVLDQQSSVKMTAQGDEHPASLDDPYAVMGAIQQVLAIDQVEGDYPIPEADDSAT